MRSEIDNADDLTEVLEELKLAQAGEDEDIAGFKMSDLIVKSW